MATIIATLVLRAPGGHQSAALDAKSLVGRNPPRTLIVRLNGRREQLDLRRPHP